MNNQPLISIIVPVYNLEIFLDKCLSSIYLQSYPHWECLIINDKSTDNSEIIAKKWCDKDNRFSYFFNKENKGLSFSRNKGIEKALGEYIVFVDSDDWVETNFLEYFIDYLENKTTLVVQDIIKDFPAYSEVKTQNYKNETLNLPGQLQQFLSNYRYTQGYACNKMFNLSIIRENNLKFYEGVANEDEVFYFEYIRYIDRIIFTEYAQYHYIQREKSLSKTYRFFPFYYYLKKTISFLNYLDQELNTQEEKVFVKQYTKKRFNSVFQLCLRNSIYYNNYTKKQRIQYLKMLKTILDKHSEILELPNSLVKKIDLFLLKNSLFFLADTFLKFRTK